MSGLSIQEVAKLQAAGQSEDGKLLIGQNRYINTWPITHMLDHDNPNMEYHTGAPAQLNQWLAEGKVEVGLISAFSYAEHAGQYVALRGLSVSSRGPVGSIFLFSKRPIEELNGCVIAMTNTSASSTNLLRILLAEMGIQPEYVTREPNLATMMDGAEAALLIGDEALYWSVQEHPYRMYDLGELWNKLTGHSMTFAICAVPKKLVETNPEKVRKIHQYFLEGKQKGYANMDAIVKAAIQQQGETEAFWKGYFAKLIHDFDEDLVRGAEAYFAAAHRHGLLPTPVKVELWGDEK